MTFDQASPNLSRAALARKADLVSPRRGFGINRFKQARIKGEVGAHGPARIQRHRNDDCGFVVGRIDFAFFGDLSDSAWLGRRLAFGFAVANPLRAADIASAIAASGEAPPP